MRSYPAGVEFANGDHPGGDEARRGGMPVEDLNASKRVMRFPDLETIIFAAAVVVRVLLLAEGYPEAARLLTGELAQALRGIAERARKLRDDG